MSTEARECALIDTSVLINFLAIDQARILLPHPRYRFILTDHVRHEVTEFYAEQKARLETVLREGAIEQIRVDTPEELEVFAALTRLGRFGPVNAPPLLRPHTGGVIAIDDRAASNHIRRAFPAVPIETTQSLIVAFIRAEVLTVAVADGFKDRWEKQHRFRLPFASFRDVL